MNDFLAQNPLVILIGACEVGFWVLLGLGLAARYLLRARRLSSVLLLLVPVLDIVLVTASLADVAGGSPPGLTHGLAAVYLGFTVAFGHSLIKWADARFAHRFAGGPAPVKPPRYGAARVAHEWKEWGKAAVAWVISVAVIALTAVVAGTGIPALPAIPSDPMWNWAFRISIAVGIWFVGWPLWTTIAPPRAPAAQLKG
ncbi:hypothetical protein [Pseudonocardia sp. TRM90224]|uniref:hypothetical protein n=1 Tax=Pseudonocardia sp. TRM90224 TaxID=2812678 RepID=UPI001E5D2BDD|nr:hypothetical protein [Pseudonocardia sp. TRM90224]